MISREWLKSLTSPRFAVSLSIGVLVVGACAWLIVLRDSELAFALGSGKVQVRDFKIPENSGVKEMQPFKPVTMTENLLFTTVRVEVMYEKGGPGTGTAFLFDMDFGQNRKVPVLITNKHVVQDPNLGAAVKGALVFHTAGKDKLPSLRGHKIVEMDAFRQNWIFHPDPNVDLAAMPYLPLRTELQKQGVELYTVSFTEDLIPTDAQLAELSAVEDVMMAGYPIGLWDDVHNFPLLRRGITATHPAVNFKGQSLMVVDLACFPGSSGSPILIINENSYGGKHGMTIGQRGMLLGTLFAGPHMTSQGEIQIKEIPMAQVPVAATNVMIHLGYVIKAKEILALKKEVGRALNVPG